MTSQTASLLRTFLAGERLPATVEPSESTAPEYSPEVRRRALRSVASRAHDGADARLLLEALGLIDASQTVDAQPLAA